MRKTLLIITLLIPLIGFGQGLNFKLGSTTLIPFSKEYLHNSHSFLIDKGITTDLGFKSIISYDFILEKINPKLILSPSISYTYINYDLIGMEFRDHYFNFSTSLGCILTKKFTTSVGLSLDTRIENKLFIKRTDETGLSLGYIGENYSDDPTIKGLTSLVSINYKINDSFFIFSHLNIPISIIGSMEEYSFNDEKLELHKRRFVSIGLGYNIF